MKKASGYFIYNDDNILLYFFKVSGINYPSNSFQDLYILFGKGLVYNKEDQSISHKTSFTVLIGEGDKVSYVSRDSIISSLMGIYDKTKNDEILKFINEEL